MNHHQVVDDVQSKLPRHVQLEDVTLLTHSLPKHRTHTHIMHAVNDACVCACVRTWAGDTAPLQHWDCWLSWSDVSGT